MTIAEQITRIKNNIASAYTSAESKGATMPAEQNSENLAITIDSITVGGGSSSKYGATLDNFLGNIEENGVLKVASSTITLNFNGVTDIQGYALRHLFRGTWGTINSVSFPDLTTLTGQNALEYAFSECAVKSINFPNLTTVTGQNAFNYTFYNCTNLATISFPKLESLTGRTAFYNTFYKITSLTSIDFPLLKEVSGYQAMYQTFNNCTGLTNINFPNLETLGESAMNNAFKQCSNLTSVSFPQLVNLDGKQSFYSVFASCTKLTNVELPELTTISGHQNMAYAFDGCTALTSISFPQLKVIGDNSISSYNGSQFNSTFRNSGVTELTFPELEYIYCTGTSNSYATFGYNTTIAKMSFPKLKDITYSSYYDSSSNYTTACKNIFYGCSNLKEIHFSAENQSTIEASLGYATLWGLGAGKATVYFDL